MLVQTIRVYETVASVSEGKPVLQVRELRSLMRALDEDSVPDTAHVNVDTLRTTEGVTFQVTVVSQGAR